jgi:hypothetical protein
VLIALELIDKLYSFQEKKTDRCLVTEFFFVLGQATERIAIPLSSTFFSKL